MRKSQDAPSWPGVYRLSLSLMESLLKTLRYNFINEALDFVGVHQERILQVCFYVYVDYICILKIKNYLVSLNSFVIQPVELFLIYMFNFVLVVFILNSDFHF